MGASFVNFMVPTTDADAVERLIADWLDRKGFLRRHEPPRFACHPDHERCAFLVTANHWTVILYSHVLDEGRRLEFELAKLDLPVLQAWVYDSDAWGHRTFVGRRVADAFYSSKRFAIGDEEPGQPTESDPVLFCETHRLPADLAQKLAEIQRGRGLFKERLLERFCAAIGATGAAMDYRDLEEPYLGVDAARDLSGVRLRRLYFAREGYDGGPPAVRLHELKVQPREEPRWQRAPISAPDAEAALPTNIRVMLALLRVLGRILRPVGWVIGKSFRVAMWLQARRLEREARSGVEPAAGVRSAYLDPAVESLFEGLPPAVSREGKRLVNHRHRCAITLPADESGDDAGDRPLPWLLFQFHVAGHKVDATAIRPDQAEHVRRMFETSPNLDLSDDRTFFAGSFPARAIHSRQRGGDRSHASFHAVAQAPTAFFVFSLRGLADGPEVPAAARDALVEVVQTFALLDQPPT